MSQLRSILWAASLTTAAACACLVLTGCSNGPASTSANASAAAAASPTASTASGTSGNSTSVRAGSTPAAVSTAGLTGNLCTDFTQVGQRLDKIPRPGNIADVAADQAAAREFLTNAAATFDGLATEAPPDVAAAIRNISAIYRTEAGVVGGINTVAQLRQEENKLSTKTAIVTNIRVIVQYMVTKCG